MPYLYIFLSAGCSLLIAHFLKMTEVGKLRTLNTLTVNYFVAAAVAAVGGLMPDSALYGFEHGNMLLLFSLAVGIFFIANFLFYSKSVHLNGVGITITAMRLSLLLPVLVSVYYYGEYLGILKTGGVLLVFAALLLLIPKKGRVKIGSVNAGWLLLIIFLLSGFADASLKIYKEEFSLQINELLFMCLVFSGAFIVGAVACIVRKGPLLTLPELKLGLLIGIPNLYSAVFLIYALDGITGSIAYPMVNMLSVVGGTALGLLRWGDSISRMQWVGLAVAIISIFILF